MLVIFLFLFFSPLGLGWSEYECIGTEKVRWGESKIGFGVCESFESVFQVGERVLSLRSWPRSSDGFWKWGWWAGKGGWDACSWVGGGVEEIGRWIAVLQAWIWATGGN